MPDLIILCNANVGKPSNVDGAVFNDIIENVSSTMEVESSNGHIKTKPNLPGQDGSRRSGCARDELATHQRYLEV